MYIGAVQRMYERMRRESRQTPEQAELNSQIMRKNTRKHRVCALQYIITIVVYQSLLKISAPIMIPSCLVTALRCS